MINIIQRYHDLKKSWLLAINNRLCVEEPFNTMRNLGNTADDTSFRGIHLELRRAFDLIAAGKLDECCEQYVFPKEEEKPEEEDTPKKSKYGNWFTPHIV